MHSCVKIVGGYPTLDVGRLRHKISILAPGPPSSPLIYDEAGLVQSWDPIVSAWAAIEQTRGADKPQTGQITTQSYLSIAMWYQPGILPNMRVQSDNGSTYIIQNIDDVLEMDVVMVLNCVALGLNE